MKKMNATPAFQQVFSTVLFLTLLSGGVSCWMASHPDLSPQQNRIFENAMTTWQVGVGTMISLLGVKAINVLPPDGGKSDDSDKSDDSEE